MNKKLFPKILKHAPHIFVLLFFFGLAVFASWTEPGSIPPSGNVAGPINTSGGTQTKAGDLVLPDLFLSATGMEGNIYNANIIQGYNDLFLRSNLTENATLYLSGSQLDFWSGTPSQPRWSINSAGTLTIGSVPWARLISLPSACPAGQYVSAVGSSLSCSAPASSGISGSGVDNYLPRWNGVGALESSVIYQKDTGEVGIGMTNPQGALDVLGNITLVGSAAPYRAATLRPQSNGSLSVWSYDDTWRSLTMGSTFGVPADLNLNVGGIYVSDKVGIGITNPQGALDVLGNITLVGSAAPYRAAALRPQSNGSLSVWSYDGTAWRSLVMGNDFVPSDLNLSVGGLYANVNVGIGTVSPNAKLAVGGAGSAGDAVAAYANSANSALYAEQTGAGYAGYFSGKVRFSSDIIVANMATCPILKTDATGLLSCNFSSYLTSESDPQVGTITTSGKWCTTDGSQINCSTDAPSGGLSSAFANVANSAGTVQFSAAEADTLRFADDSNNGLSVSFSSADKKIAYSVDTTKLQKRVTGSCSAGSSIRAIASDGTVTCETDDSGIGGISGSGADNYLPRWSGTGALESSVIYQKDTGEVGIGTTAPNAKLAVGGAGSAGDAVAAYANSANSALYAEQTGAGYAGYFSGKVRFSSDIIVGQTANAGFEYSSGSGDLYLGGDNGQAGNIYINDSSGARKIVINSDASSYFKGGNIGIGDSSPASLLTVGEGDLFQVSSSGNLVKVNNVSYSWPASQGSASTYLKNDGSGNLSWGGVVTDGVPAGMIAMFDTSCPSGWSRFSALDNRVPRGSATYGGTGGGDATTVHYEGSGSGYSVHNYGWPPYLNVIWCKKN